MSEPPSPRDLPVPDETLDAFAAGELTAADADLLRARAARDPALARRLAAAVRLEVALLAQEPVPVPLGLVAATRGRIEGAPAEKPALPRKAERTAIAAAAAVVLAVGGWGGLGRDAFGSLPRLPVPVPAVEAGIESVVGAAVPSVDAWSGLAGGPSVAGPAALLATLLGVAVSIRRAGAARRSSPGSGTACAG